VRVMRTEYRIDAFQQSYFVVDSFDELFEACYGTDFAPIYQQYAAQPAYAADAALPGDSPVAAASPATAAS
jgi:phenylalanine-4-hydroxylase